MKRIARDNAGSATVSSLVTAILMLMGAGPVLAAGADPILGPLSLVFLTPFIAAAVGIFFTVVWLINKAVDRYTPSAARLR